MSMSVRVLRVTVMRVTVMRVRVRIARHRGDGVLLLAETTIGLRILNIVSQNTGI